jgi:hypothetical protein
VLPGCQEGHQGAEQGHGQSSVPAVVMDAGSVVDRSEIEAVISPRALARAVRARRAEHRRSRAVEASQAGRGRGPAIRGMRTSARGREPETVEWAPQLFTLYGSTVPDMGPQVRAIRFYCLEVARARAEQDDFAIHETSGYQRSCPQLIRERYREPSVRIRRRHILDTPRRQGFGGFGFLNAGQVVPVSDRLIGNHFRTTLPAGINRSISKLWKRADGVRGPAPASG